MFTTGTEGTVSTTEAATFATTTVVSARSAWLLWTSIVDDEGTAIQWLSIQSFDSFSSIISIFHLNKAEAFRHAGELICHDPHGGDRTIR